MYPDLLPLSRSRHVVSTKKSDPYALGSAEANRDRLLKQRDELGRIRGHAISDYEWDVVKAMRRNEDILVVALADLLDDLANVPPVAGATPPRRPVDAERKPMEHGRTRAGALSALVALAAAQRPDVQAWRQRALLDRLLPLDDHIADWLRERTGKVGTGEIELLDYATPSSTAVERIAVERGGLLDDLRKLAEKLATDYRWSPYHAAVFVLTADVPLVPSIRTTVLWSSSVAESCIRLEIDPWTDPKRVAETYAKARGEHVPGRRFKPPGQQALDVVEWVARFYAGDPTREALRGWNVEWTKRKQPDRKYDELRKFQRVYRETVAKVLDPKIL